MRVLPSTIVPASVGAAVTASATSLLVLYGYSLGESWVWCVMGLLIGPLVLFGAFVRDRTLRLSPEQYRRIVSDLAEGGPGIGLDVSSTHHHGSDGGNHSGGGDGGVAH